MYRQAQPSQDVHYAYNPHGAVVAQERVRLGAFAYQVQEFRNDAYGNVFYSRTRSSASGDEAPSVADYFNDGLLINATPSCRHRARSRSPWWTRYTPDEKLAVVQRNDYRVGSGASLGSWEEYWYDALGRRILTRARRNGSPPTGTGPLCNDPAGNSCQSYYQRTLWDGDQILYEWRVADGTATGYNSGTAGYVHLEGMDQPVGLIRSDGKRVLNYTWRGLGESSVFTNGAPGDVSLPGGSLAVPWPTRTQGGVYFTPNVLASGSSGPFTWFGTLAENGAGSTGLLYRRNRYFDPVSGRFTQADPIGLAGGLNLYGFANGDPVNFTDPFGLCPDGAKDCSLLQRFVDWIAPKNEALKRAAASLSEAATQLDAALSACGPGIACGVVPFGGAIGPAGVVGAASRGSGNFGLGIGTAETAAAAGRAWVGSGARLASDGRTLLSQNGLRQYRPPSFKPALGVVQANFQSRAVPRGPWDNNGHLTILIQQRLP